LEQAQKRLVIGFIGTGHLGSMLVRKFVETRAIDAHDILASNRTAEKAERLAASTGIRIENNQTVAKLSDVVFICVRPLEVGNVLRDLEHLLTPEKLLVSVAGDVSLKNLQTHCRARVARAFPSMASECLKGVTLLSFGDNTTALDKNLITQLFCAIGNAIEADEKDFGVLADLTSCAPGYIAAIMHEFVLAAKRKGIPEDLAERLVKQTLAGTAQLLEEKSLQELVCSVATKGGITEAGVKVIAQEAPKMFDRLFLATEANHKQVRKSIDSQAELEK
jgi:pyrroline-5-carboxylate reductase/competence protein ComER